MSLLDQFPRKLENGFFEELTYTDRFQKVKRDEGLYQTKVSEFISLQDGTRTKTILKGEKFVLSCLDIQEIDGKRFLVTEIGIVNLKA